MKVLSFLLSFFVIFKILRLKREKNFFFFWGGAFLSVPIGISGLLTFLAPSPGHLKQKENPKNSLLCCLVCPDFHSQ